jgi:hypothetical protein
MVIHKDRQDRVGVRIPAGKRELEKIVIKIILNVNGTVRDYNRKKKSRPFFFKNASKNFKICFQKIFQKCCFFSALQENRESALNTSGS